MSTLKKIVLKNLHLINFDDIFFNFSDDINIKISINFAETLIFTFSTPSNSPDCPIQPQFHHNNVPLIDPNRLEIKIHAIPLKFPHTEAKEKFVSSIKLPLFRAANISPRTYFYKETKVEGNARSISNKFHPNLPLWKMHTRPAPFRNR